MLTAKLMHTVADQSTSAPPQDAKVSNTNQIRTLTGLLFLPLAVITWHHARDYWVPMRGFLDDCVYFKHFVTLLFVLSGYAAARQFDIKSTGASLHFYLGRLARIWPVHVACLVLLLVSVSEVFTIRAQWFPIFLSNLFMVQTWVPMAKWYWSYNSPSYATSTLWWCELAFPILLIAARRSKSLVLIVTGMVVLALICASNALHLPGDDMTNASLRGLLYVSPLARLFEFAVGVVAALVSQSIAPQLKLSGLTATAMEAAAIGLVIFVNMHSADWSCTATKYVGDAGAFWFHNSGDNLLPLALLVAVLASGRGLVSKFFASPTMVFLGQISIAFYMLHAVFSAYFFANFLEERALLPAFFFFSSLLVAAHVVHVCLFDPVRKQFVKQGSKLLSLKWPAPVSFDGVDNDLAYTANISSKSHPHFGFRKSSLIAVEAAVASYLFYLALPTVHPVTAAESETIGAMASVHSVQFDPWLDCKSADAVYRNGQVEIKAIWQSRKPESIDFYITAQVLDKSGAILATSRCAMDGRHQGVVTGSLWPSHTYISVPSSAQAANVAIKLTHGKKSQLAPRSDAAGQVDGSQMIVPVRSDSAIQ